MTQESPEQIDLSILMAAMIDNEGGSYALPFSVYYETGQTTGLGITMDLTDDGSTILLGLDTIDGQPNV